MVAIDFTPLTESHFPLLLKWLSSPHVKRWWDQDVQWTPALIEERYIPYTKGYKIWQLEDGEVIERPMHALVVKVDGEFVGYIQYYRNTDFPSERGHDYEGLPQNCGGLDGYIGEESFTGRGLGPRIFSNFLKQYVFHEFDFAFVEPDVANTRAIRAYEKAGFKVVKSLDRWGVVWMLKGREPNCIKF